LKNEIKIKRFSRGFFYSRGRPAVQQAHCPEQSRRACLPGDWSCGGNSGRSDILVWREWEDKGLCVRLSGERNDYLLPLDVDIRRQNRRM